MTHAALLQSQTDATVILTLNRPEKRNALSLSLIVELYRALDEAVKNDTVRALILTGTGRAFCAGLDLEEVRDFAVNQDRAAETAGKLYDTLELIYHCPKPVIGAVNGYAVAGGAGLMSVCDVVVANQTARIGYPEIKRGLAAAIVMPYLIRQVGERRARYLLLTGELLHADQAQRIGLIDEVVASADLLPRACVLARDLGTCAPQAFRNTKEWLIQAQFLDPQKLAEHARKLHSRTHASPEAAAGAKRFFEAGG